MLTSSVIGFRWCPCDATAAERAQNSRKHIAWFLVATLIECSKDAREHASRRSQRRENDGHDLKLRLPWLRCDGQQHGLQSNFYSHADVFSVIVVNCRLSTQTIDVTRTV